ncbi:MAG: glycosyltransferase [Flavobacteriaceae bacterium]|nr:glycosyltransferase [Flavobacteriaceae bacterium]
MAQRNRVGLVFTYNESWIGGVYYFLNLVSSLNLVHDVNKPVISIISRNRESYDFLKKQTNYPYLEYYYESKSLSLFHKGVNRGLKLLNLPKAFNSRVNRGELDMIYQYYADSSIEMNPKVYWIPDFQEKFLPKFFSAEEIKQRQDLYEQIADQGQHVAFSSYNALSHFETFFPNSKIQKHVLQFAVTHPDYKLEEAKAIRGKHNLPERYFFTPNQFWEHKNHKVVLKSVKYLKDKGIEIVVAFSGNENDYRNKDYLDSLKDYIRINNLSEQIYFLGFLPRIDQLTLMKNAISIIQPSLFEGWSTVVEDAKALNSYLILSNLEVHKEQIDVNVTFFDPKNEIELAVILEKYSKEDATVVIKNYTENIVRFGNSFIALIEKITS